MFNKNSSMRSHQKNSISLEKNFLGPSYELRGLINIKIKVAKKNNNKVMKFQRNSRCIRNRG